MLLSLQALAEPPRRSGPKAVAALVARLGYVQIDSINVLERAHHHILATRLDGYRPTHLATNLERERVLFEHWTHDASAIPTAWYPNWGRRFAAHSLTSSRTAWWRERFGTDPALALARVHDFVRERGPIRARDLPSAHRPNGAGWWDWSPEKTALEHLWRQGAILIARREGFEKLYDVAERVLPSVASGARPADADVVRWACREALARTGIATPKELAGYFGVVTLAEARAWTAAALAAGEVVSVEVERADGGKPVASVALPGWRDLRREPDRARMVILSPFDPVIRDRARALRLFGFDYRFEAFVPAPARRYGYYVLPLLEGDRLVGRVDPKYDRAAGVIELRGPWWERGSAAERARWKRGFELAMDRLATTLGAARWRRVRAHRGKPETASSE